MITWVKEAKIKRGRIFVCIQLLYLFLRIMKFHAITHFTKQYCDFHIHRNVYGWNKITIELCESATVLNLIFYKWAKFNFEIKIVHVEQIDSIPRVPVIRIDTV